MKKPLLAALGLAGACVACCTVPLAIPLLGGGAAAAALATWLGFELNLQAGALLLLVFFLVATAGYALLVWARRKKASACAPSRGSGAACSVKTSMMDCGCSPGDGALVRER